jgi:radical SAM superfamily enzyme YgiQ (UPF0313 family)
MGTDMRILLVRPPQPDETVGLKHIMICEPLELEYVAAGVPEHDVRIHDMLMSDGLDKLLHDFKPDIVGTGCYINNVFEALALCKHVKKIVQEVKTVMGGVHAIFNPKDFEYDYVDYIVQGEGITTFKEIVSSLENNGNPESILGIGYRTDDGFRYTAHRPFPKNVNEFPLPDRNLLKDVKDKYFYFRWSPLALIRTSWGCPYKCSFCYNRHVTDGMFYARSPESIVAELESIQTKHVFIVDDTFLFNKKRLERIYQLIKEKNIKKEFLVYGRTDFIAQNKDILQKWYDIGLTIIRVGLEGVTDEELNSYNKRNTIENNNKALEVCREIGIEVSASFIIPPHYDDNDFNKVAQYIKEKGLVYIFLNPLTPLPGIELYNRYKDQLIVPYTKGYPLWDFQHCVLQPTRMSLKSFYRRMFLIYLASYNPFKKSKARRGAKVSLFSRDTLNMYKNLFISFYEMFFAYRNHMRVIKRRNNV